MSVQEVVFTILSLIVIMLNMVLVFATTNETDKSAGDKMYWNYYQVLHDNLIKCHVNKVGRVIAYIFVTPFCFLSLILIPVTYGCLALVYYFPELYCKIFKDKTHE